MLKLYKELKRRKVLRTLGAYAAAAFVIMQVADTVFPRLNFPDWTVAFVIILIIMGFPITFFLSWTYDLKREDETDNKSEYEDVGSNKKPRKLLLPITGFLTIIGVSFWVWYSLGSFSQGSDVDNKIFKSIAVLYLDNQSNDPKDVNICAGLTASITTALHRLGRFNVKARTDVLKFRNKIKSHKEIWDMLGVDAYIEGSLFKDPGNNKYIANFMLIDAERGDNIWAKEYTKTAEELSGIPNTIASDVAQFLTGDEVQDFEVLNNLSDISGDDESFSLMGEGINLLDSKQYDQSIMFFDSVLVSEPDNNRAIYSKGKALEGLGQYASAINSYNQILTKVNPAARAKLIWSHPDVLKFGVKKVNIMRGLKISAELNIQIGALYNEDRNMSEIQALDLNTHEVIWKRSYSFFPSLKIVGNNLVVANSTLRGHGENEAAVYVHSLKNGSLLYSKEFSKENPEQKVLINILNNQGADVPAFQDAVYLHILRDNDYQSLVMIDLKSNKIILEKVIPKPGVLEGKPRVFLVEEGEKKYLLHQKGINLYLFDIDGDRLVWNRALLDDSYRVVIANNVMCVYSKNETGIVLQNIISQKNIGKFELDSPPVRGYHLNENKKNVLIQSKNSITSIKTYKPFLRSIDNWTQYIDKNDEISWVHNIYDNLFVTTKSGDLYCVNKKTGEIIYKNQIGQKVEYLRYPEWNADGSSPKSVILYAGDFLLGLDPNNGKTLWKIRELNVVTKEEKGDDKSWRVWWRIVPLGNKVIVMKQPDEKHYIILKAYNRMTGELLWISEEPIFKDMTKNMFGTIRIMNEFLAYSHNNNLFIGASPEGFIYNVDISWKPNRNYVSKTNLYNSLAFCYNKINDQVKASELLENIIDIVDQQNEDAFQQLSNIYKNSGDNINYIKSQIRFHELIFYDEIKRGNVENQLTQTSGLQWVQHFKRRHDFAVHFPDNNIIVAGLCNDDIGCTLKYFRAGSGILIGENNLDIQSISIVRALNDRLLFIGRKENEGGGTTSSLFAIDSYNQSVINKVPLEDGYYFTNDIYHFGDLYIIDYDRSPTSLNSDQLMPKSHYLTAVDIDKGAVLWENKYEFNLLNSMNQLKLVNNDGLIIVPLSEEFQAINLFSGELDWTYEFDEFDGLKYIDQKSLNGDNLFFLTDDNEFVGLNLTSREIIFFSDEISFDYKLNVSFLNHNYMLAHTSEGKVVLYENNGTEMVQSWIEDFKQPINILDVIDNTVYIESLEDRVITAINLENPKNKHVSNILWDVHELFINNNSYGIYNNRKLYFISI